MPVPHAVLRDLHHIHRQLAELHGRLERGPQQIRIRELSAKRLSDELNEAREKVKQTRMAVDRKQLDLKTGENKIVDLKAKLNACSSNKEYQALLEQISAAEMANSVFADEILEGMDKIDQLEVLVVAADKNFAAGQQDLDKVKRQVEGTADAIRGDVARFEAELAKAEASLPPEFRVDYVRVVRGKGADGLAVAEDGVCGGCGQQITLNMQNELMLSRLVPCKNCGRLLYMPESG